MIASGPGPGRPPPGPDGVVIAPAPSRGRSCPHHKYRSGSEGKTRSAHTHGKHARSLKSRLPDPTQLCSAVAGIAGDMFKVTLNGFDSVLELAEDRKSTRLNSSHL